MAVGHRLRLALLALGLAGVCVGCDDDSPARPPVGPTDAGVEDASDASSICAAGEALVDGGCVLAGVPEGKCAEGFSSDQRGGCTPVLPEAPCSGATMAIPGDTRCRPIAPCGDPPWGDIPVDDTTQYVDGSYDGGDSDGTAARPWTSVQAAVIAAPPGGIVAIAAGTYPESPVSTGKPVKLWGRCPELVELASAERFEALVIDADGTEVHTLALTSTLSFGVLLAGATGVVLDRIWIHDTGDYGVLIAGFQGPTDLEMRGSVIEAATAAGVAIIAAQATLEETVIRGGVFDPLLGPGRGLDLGDDAETGLRSEVILRRSVIEANRESGVVVFGSDLTMDSSVVRDTAAGADGKYGIGVAFQPGRGPSHGTMIGSVVADSRSIGVSVIGSELSIERSVTAATAPQELGNVFGDGLTVVFFQGLGTVGVSQSKISGSARAGISSFGGSVTIGATALDCNAIHLDGELIGGEFEFADQGGNACSCGSDADSCQVVSSNLSPPTALR